MDSDFPNADPQKVFANKIKRVQSCIDARGQWRTNFFFGKGLYARNFFGGEGVNKVSSGQRAERTGILGRLPPSQGFPSICTRVKSIFRLGCYDWGQVLSVLLNRTALLEFRSSSVGCGGYSVSSDNQALSVPRTNVQDHFVPVTDVPTLIKDK
jgi:hypothetical protein